MATMTLVRGSTETVHHAVFACGVGLDAAVVQRAEKEPYRKYRFGSIHYASSALGTALQDFPRRRTAREVRSGDRRRLATAALDPVPATYTPTSGRSHFRFTPGAPEPMECFRDGRLRRRSIPRIATSVLTGRDLGSLPGIEVWKTWGACSR